MDEKDKENKKNDDLEVVSGDGKNLDISPVESHIKLDRPNKPKDKDKKIIIPKAKKEDQ